MSVRLLKSNVSESRIVAWTLTSLCLRPRASSVYRSATSIAAGADTRQQVILHRTDVYFVSGSASIQRSFQQVRLLFILKGKCVPLFPRPLVVSSSLAHTL